MSRKRYPSEQIISMLREAEVALAQGQSVGQACRTLGVSEHSYYRWRKEYGGLRTDQAKRLKDLEKENGRLRKADEILNTEIFSTLKEAKVLIERWRHHYNTIRPHSSLGYRPPAPETILPNVEGPTYAVDGLRLAHQLNPRQTLT